MKKSKIIKLLCLLFIFVFIIGLGGELVGAVPDTIKVGVGEKIDEFGSGWYFFMKTDQNTGRYVFCLDSNKHIPKSGEILNLNSSLLSGKQNNIMKVIAKAYEIGLGSGSNSYGVSERELFAITQMAVWKQAHGTGTGGYIKQYRNWVEKNPTYVEIFNVLDSAVKSETSGTLHPGAGFATPSAYLTESDDYLVSKDLYVYSYDVPSTVKFTVKIDSGSTESSCLLYNNQCTSELEVTANTKFQVRVDKPSTGTGDVKVLLSLTSESFNSGYDIGLYSSNNSSTQGMASITPKTTTVTGTQMLTGEYVNPIDVQIQKIDADSGKKVAGAELEVYDATTGYKIGTYTSTNENEENPRVLLPIGDYYLVETDAPNGYIKSDEKVEFSVIEDNGSIKLKQGDNIVDSATISISNKLSKIIFKKVAIDGTPLEGIRIEIGSYLKESILGNVDKPYLCAYTDEEGLLTIPCEGYEDVVNSDGAYTLGIDFGSFDDTYYIYEEFPEGYYVADFADKFTDFYLVDGEILVWSNNLDYTKISGFGTIYMAIYNENYIDISKTDVTTGKEIAGATLKVEDLSNNIYDDEGNSEYAVIDEWTSKEGESHRIHGIVAGQKYRLSEMIAPEGYLKMTTSIDFVMDKDGNVTVYEPDTDKEIDDMASSDYKLLVTNDYTKVGISKTDMVTGEEIAGAELKICTAKAYEEKQLECTPSKEEWSWTSEEGKSHIIERLVPGEYWLIETTAPEGYARQTKSISFTVEETGEIQPVEFKNQPTKVTVSKLDRDTDKPIVGVTLQIFNEDGTEAYDADGNLLKWETDGNPKVINKLAVGNYYVRELVTVEGYEEDMIVDGEVFKQYQFSITDADYEHEIVIYNATIKTPNTGISTINLFAIGGLLIFVGYQTVKIYRRRTTN